MNTKFSDINKTQLNYSTFVPIFFGGTGGGLESNPPDRLSGDDCGVPGQGPPAAAAYSSKIQIEI